MLISSVNEQQPEWRSSQSPGGNGPLRRSSSNPIDLLHQHQRLSDPSASSDPESFMRKHKQLEGDSGAAVGRTRVCSSSCWSSRTPETWFNTTTHPDVKGRKPERPKLPEPPQPGSDGSGGSGGDSPGFGCWMGSCRWNSRTTERAPKSRRNQRERRSEPLCLMTADTKQGRLRAAGWPQISRSVVTWEGGRGEGGEREMDAG